jgi:hypothetical protein
MLSIITNSSLHVQEIAREHKPLVAQVAAGLAAAKSARKPARFGEQAAQSTVVLAQSEDPIDPHFIVPVFVEFSRASARETAASPVYARLRLTQPDGHALVGYGRSVPRVDAKHPSAALAAVRSLGLSIPHENAWRWRTWPVLVVLALAAGWPAEQLEIML